MAKLNAVKLIEEYRGKINCNYDLSTSHMADILKNSKGKYSVICNFFIFGYAQGRKAAKAEMRKAGK